MRGRDTKHPRDSSLPPALPPSSRSASASSRQSFDPTEHEANFDGTDINDFGGYEEEDEQAATEEHEYMKTARKQGRTTGSNVVSTYTAKFTLSVLTSS